MFIQRARKVQPLVKTSVKSIWRDNSKRRLISSKRYFSSETGAKVASPGKVHNSATPPPPPTSGGGGGNGFWILLTAGLVGSGYYFKEEIEGFLGYGKPKEGEDLPKEAVKDVEGTKKFIEEAEEKLQETIEAEKQAAAPVVSDGKEVVKQTVEADWNKIREEIADILENPKADFGNYGPLLVRLAWHNAGTYDKKTGKGGSEGAAMRFHPEASWGANNGLDLARKLLEPIKKKHPEVTYSDLWSFAGTVAIEEMGGPEIKWRPGRKDCVEGENVLRDGLLPDADGRDHPTAPGDHLRDIFYRMGFNDQEIVALSGAHCLGRCHKDRSGYVGPWTFAPTTFSNEYFVKLLEETWTEKKTDMGKPWDGNQQFEDKTKLLMMLPSDMALIQDVNFRKYVDLYAKNEEKFFEDFAKAWIKLQENGVRKFHGWRRYIFFGPRE